MFRTHGINPPYSKMTENRSGNAERDPAPSTANPKRIADSEDSRHATPARPVQGQMTLGTSADDGGSGDHQRSGTSAINKAGRIWGDSMSPKVLCAGTSSERRRRAQASTRRPR